LRWGSHLPSRRKVMIHLIVFQAMWDATAAGEGELLGSRSGAFDRLGMLAAKRSLTLLAIRKMARQYGSGKFRSDHALLVESSPPRPLYGMPTNRPERPRRERR